MWIEDAVEGHDVLFCTGKWSAVLKTTIWRTSAFSTVIHDPTIGKKEDMGQAALASNSTSMYSQKRENLIKRSLPETFKRYETSTIRIDSSISDGLGITADVLAGYSS